MLQSYYLLKLSITTLSHCHVINYIKDCRAYKNFFILFCCFVIKFGCHVSYMIIKSFTDSMSKYTQSIGWRLVTVRILLSITFRHPILILSILSQLNHLFIFCNISFYVIFYRLVHSLFPSQRTLLPPVGQGLQSVIHFFFSVFFWQFYFLYFSAQVIILCLTCVTLVLQLVQIGWFSAGLVQDSEGSYIP